MLKRIYDALRLSLAARKMKAEELYVIESHHPELANQVREAMVWLTSEAADHIGLKQLRKACALNLSLCAFVLLTKVSVLITAATLSLIQNI